MKENKSLFYLYFAGFLSLAYIGRAILSPTEHHFVLWMQIVSLIILPHIYRNLLSSSKFLSGIFFFLFLVLMFEVSNFIPIIGLALSTVISVHLGYTLAFEWSFYVLKPLFIIGFLVLNFKSTLLFFSALKADKKYIVSNNSKLFKSKITELEANAKNYAPKDVSIYFNESSQILTFSVNKNEISKLKRFIYLSKSFNRTSLLAKKSNLDYKLLLKDNVLQVKSKNCNILLDYDEFSASLKDIVNEIIKNKEKEEV